MNRRHDHQLRQAISSIERMLLGQPNLDQVLNVSLEQAMQLLGAQYGYAMRCSQEINNRIPWLMASCYRRISGMLIAVDDICSSAEIPSTFTQALSAGRCLTGPSPLQGQLPLPHHHPNILSYIAIPIVDSLEIHGVLFICNTEAKLDTSTENRLRPFMASVTCVARAAKNREQFQHVEDASQWGAAGVSLRVAGLFDELFDAVLVIDEKDQIIYCNVAACRLTVSSKKNLLGKSITDFLKGDAVNIEERFLSDKRGIPSAWHGLQLHNNRGDIRKVDIRSALWRSNSRSLKAIIINDVSEKVTSLQDYHTILQRFQVLTNAVPVAILQVNTLWQCTYVNDTWCDYTQLNPDESFGKGWMLGLHSDDADRVISMLYQQTSQHGLYRDEFRLQTPLGKSRWVESCACGVFNDHGESVGLIITFNDITERLSTENRLREMAERDQLTGLVNRAFFNDRVAVALKGVPRFGMVSLMFIDLDNFKYINDTLGHDAGDQLLQTIANRLKNTVRKVDTVARLGGDEFTILITNVKTATSLGIIATKIIDALQEPVHINGEPIYVTCSVGISVANEENSDATSILKKADTALYKAKSSGKNQYKFYTQELDAEATLHMLLKKTLLESSDQHFSLVFQPQVDARSGELYGFEVLTRWQHPEVADVAISQVIDNIEKTGLIHDFSHWLTHKTFETLAQWISEGYQLPKISINLSAKQLYRENLAEFYLEMCQHYGVAIDNISLEITETAMLGDPTLAQRILSDLRSAGFKIALDDFGTGYSSLNYLSTMPIDEVKIDRSFIIGIDDNDKNAKIVKSIIGLMEAMSMQVIAEGIDKHSVSNWLIENSCFVHQGFFYHFPMPANEAKALLTHCHEPAELC